MSKKKGTPAWIWIGCGCFLCIVLIVGAIGGLGFAGFSWVQSLVEDMADPQARTAAALDMLGAETLPPDYHARAFFSLPFLMELVILSDGPPPVAIEAEDFEEKAEQLSNLVLTGENMGANTLIYLKLRKRNAEDAIEDVLAGQGRGNTDIDLGVEFEAASSLGQGELEVHGERVTWRAYRGRMDTVGGDHTGIFAAVQVFCASSEIHDLLWFQKTQTDTVSTATAPAPAAPATSSSTTNSSTASDSAQIAAGAAIVETVGTDVEAIDETSTEASTEPQVDVDDVQGSPADPEALSTLLSYFHVCQ